MRRPELVLAGAVAICLPMVPGVLDGNIGATTNFNSNQVFILDLLQP